MDIGPSLVVAGALLGIGTALFLRVKLPALVVGALLVVAGLWLGMGALMMLTEDPSRLAVALTLVITGIGAPLQARALLGPFGKTAPGSSGTVGDDQKGI